MSGESSRSGGGERASGGERRSGSSAGGAGPSGASRASDAARSYCAFWLGDQCFCVGIELVGELVAVESMLPVPLSPPAVVGLFNLRGTPVALVDLAELLDLPAAPRDERRALLALVLRTNDLLAGIVIDKMEAVLTGGGRMTRPDDRDEAGSPIEGFLEIEAAGGAVARVLDEEKLLQRLREIRVRSSALDDAPSSS